MQDQIDKLVMEQQALQAEIHAFWLREQVTEQAIQSKNYTKGIVLGGYGFLISVWLGLRGYIPAICVGWAIFLIGISFILFVSHEFYRAWKEGSLISHPETICDLSAIETIKVHNKFIEGYNERKNYIIFWYISFIGALVGGILSFIVMAGGFIYCYGWRVHLSK